MSGSLDGVWQHFCSIEYFETFISQKSIFSNMMKNNNSKGPKAAVNDDNMEIVDNMEEMVDQNNASDPEVIEAELANDMVDIETLNKQLLEAQEQVAKEKKEYMFLMAEFDNFRKRTVKEKSEIIKNATERAMKELLPIVDDFERGLEANKNAENAEGLKEGMELIYNKLIKYLEKNGVKPIESTGQPFDPDYHEAIAMVPVEDPEMKGKVIDTPAKGYTINDKVLRHAKVAVGQ